MSKHTKYFNKFCVLSCCVRLIPLPYSFVSFDRYVQINASWGWKTSVRGQCTTVLYYSGFPKSVNLVIIIIIIIIIINSLTERVVGAPQMILQPVFSIFPALHCPLGLAELQACPFSDVVFPPLPLSALSSFPFHCALQDGFGQT